MKKSRLAAALLVFCCAAGAWAETAPLAPVNRVVAVTWAADLHRFFASPQPDFASIQTVADSLGRVKANDWRTLESLKPVIDQLRRDSTPLLRASLPTGSDPALPAKIVKLKLLAAPAFNRHLYYEQRMRAAPLLETYRRRLAEQERAKVETRLAEMSLALGSTETEPASQPTDGPVAAQARAYFREKGIPVSSIKYSDGYEVSGGMGAFADAGASTRYPAELTVSFPDVATYRRWAGALPKKITGVSVYVDGSQRASAESEDQVAREEITLTQARDHLSALGIPASSINYSEGGEVPGGMGAFADAGAPSTYYPSKLTVTFPDAASAVKWHGSLPAKIDGIDVQLDPKHEPALKVDRLARQKQAVRDYFEGQGVHVLGIEYRESYYDSGMNWDLPGVGEVPERLVVTLSDAKVARKWNRRVFRGTAVAGIGIEARGPESR